MKKLGMFLVSASAGWLAQTASAGHGHGGCDSCCTDCGSKTCRLVCEMKTIKVTCWGCECEDFCVPGKSCEGCEHCDSCGCPCTGDCHSSAPDCHFRWKEYTPGDCAEVYTRKKLVKYEAEKKIPSFHWVVEECGCCNGAPGVAPGVPAAPVEPAAPVGPGYGPGIRGRAASVPVSDMAPAPPAAPVSYQQPIPYTAGGSSFRPR